MENIMEELMTNITEVLDYIQTGTTNSFIIKECNIIDIKLSDIRDKRYNMVATVQSVCDSIINKDISNMKGVLNQPEEMYAKYDELESLVAQIPSVY